MTDRTTQELGIGVSRPFGQTDQDMESIEPDSGRRERG